MIHADNTTAIQAAIDGLPDGGVILLKSKIVLTTSLSSTADISFIGLGYQTGLSGTADPLLTIDGDYAGDLKMYATPTTSSGMLIGPPATTRCGDHRANSWHVF